MAYDIVTVTVIVIMPCHIPVTFVTVMYNITSFPFTKFKIRKEIERIENKEESK